MLGYPGAGKTTTAKIVSELTGAVHLWADHERRNRFGEPQYTKQENTELYAELNERAAGLLKQGRSVIFDTNFNFVKDREHLAEIAKDNGASTQLLWITTPKAIAKQRATKDAHKQGTRILGNMPEQHFERMTNNLQEPLPHEKAIELDGTKITMEYVKKQLGL